MFRLIQEKTLRSIKVGASRRISARALVRVRDFHGVGDVS